MTLLINELISLLEKDNKSNNDNSKIITANNPEKIYNNLISLLSKNIEDFITATESKEDILLRGLNDLKARFGMFDSFLFIFCLEYLSKLLMS